jgi:hypothetical protein
MRHTMPTPRILPFPRKVPPVIEPQKGGLEIGVRVTVSQPWKDIEPETAAAETAQPLPKTPP